MNIDIKDSLETIYNLHGIEPFEEQWTFYYDESGNCRKFILTEKGVNSEESIVGDFVLAGVAHEGSNCPIDVFALNKILGLQKNQKEFKFKNLYCNSKSFLDFIREQRTNDFLKWLFNSGLYIHYSTINNLFYATADIIDSLLAENPQCIIYMWEIKNIFYDFICAYKSVVLYLLYKYQYPNIVNCRDFSLELCELISEYSHKTDDYDEFVLELIRQMLKTAGKRNKLVFAQDNKPFLLIQEYYLFYLERCESFYKSNHYFDEEPTVQKKIRDIHLFYDKEEIVNYKFIKSNDSVLIQLSDVVAGLIRKLFSFLDSLDYESVIQISKIESELQVVNFRIIWELLSKSDAKSKLFLKNANTPKNINERMEKLEILSYI